MTAAGRWAKAKEGFNWTPLASKFNGATEAEGTAARIAEEKKIRLRYKVIEKRPQFTIRYIRILHELGPDGPRVVQVHYRNGNVEEGVQHVILKQRYQRIRALAIESLRQFPPP